MAGDSGSYRNQLGDRLRQSVTVYGRYTIRGFQRAISEAGEVERGTSYPSINDYIHGRVVPPVDFVLATARLCGVRVEWLAGGSGEPTQELQDRADERRRARQQRSSRVRSVEDRRDERESILQREFSSYAYLQPEAADQVDVLTYLVHRSIASHSRRDQTETRKLPWQLPYRRVARAFQGVLDTVRIRPHPTAAQLDEFVVLQALAIRALLPPEVIQEAYPVL